MEWEFGVSRCKLLHTGWVTNKVLRQSTGNCIQHPVINHNGKRFKKEYMYVCVCGGGGGFAGSSAVENLPAKQEMLETWVRPLDWEDPLEEGMATHSNILAWRIPWADESGRLQSMELQRVGHD